MTFEDMLNDEPYKSCYEKGLADGEAKGKQEAIEGMLCEIKKSVISISARDGGADYSSIYRWIENIAEHLKEGAKE